MSDPLGTALTSTVDEGRERLGRTWPALLATGTIGGIDVSLGVLASLLLAERTGSDVLAAFGFAIGFIALTLGNSELFTENFLVPVAAVATDDDHHWWELGRLWAGTALTNLLGGVLVAWIALAAFPELGEIIAEKGAEYAERGVSVEAFASAVLAGVVITVMTWMQKGARSDGGRIVAAVAAAFLLSYGELAHVIVASIEVLGGALSDEPSYGFGAWVRQVWVWALGNAVGGMGLVTVLRLVQVGRRRLAEASDQAGEMTASERQPQDDEDDEDDEGEAARDETAEHDWPDSNR